MSPWCEIGEKFTIFAVNEKVLSWLSSVIIIGLRRCGKSYLLSVLYKEVLLSESVNESDIIEVSLEKKSNAKYRNPIALQDYILSKTADSGKKYYEFIDEIQMCLSVSPAKPWVRKNEKQEALIEVLSITVYPDTDREPEENHSDLTFFGKGSHRRGTIPVYLKYQTSNKISGTIS